MLIMHELEPFTFAQALRDKYVEQEVFDNLLVLPRDKSIRTDITLVGFGKISCIQQQLRQLTSIDLSNKSIGTVGNVSDLKGHLNKVKVLNLANNLMSWHDIIDIIHCFPNLKELIITKNFLEIEESIFIDQNKTHRKLSCLSLGRVDLKWSQVIRVLSHIWTSIEELDLWDNKLSDNGMTIDPTLLEVNKLFIASIKSLQLSHNHFIDINWIQNIGPLKCLTELDLSWCQLERIEISHKIKDQLKNLKILKIPHNNISDWSSISNLYHLQSLENLLCVDNPIFIKNQSAKPLTVGRLGGLKVLNREEITDGQRKDSELFYLRNTFPDYQLSLSDDNNTKSFRLNHPRYDQLMQTYGIPEDLNKKQVIDKYITVDLSYQDKRLSKKLPCDMRVSNVKMLCKRLFNLRPSAVIALTCCDTKPETSAIQYELDKDGQTLNFFSVKTGQTLTINEQN